nr:preprotein translocase subunit YajC [Kineococcus siccus]
MVFLLLMVALLVFMFSRTRKQQKAQQQMQSGVAPGAEVMTTSGTFGRVVAIDGDVVTLEIAPGVQTRWTRRAVSRVVTSSPVAPGEGDGVGPAGTSGLDLRKDVDGNSDTPRA